MTLPPPSTLKETVMALFNFRRKEDAARRRRPLEAFLKGYSIEVMPRTAEKVENFRAILPTGTRVYIAHIEGTPIEDMVATAKRIGDEGFDRDAALPGAHHQGQGHADRLGRPLQGCGRASRACSSPAASHSPVGDFSTSMQLLEIRRL